MSNTGDCPRCHQGHVGEECPVGPRFTPKAIASSGASMALDAEFERAFADDEARAEVEKAIEMYDGGHRATIGDVADALSFDLSDADPPTDRALLEASAILDADRSLRDIPVADLRAKYPDQANAAIVLRAMVADAENADGSRSPARSAAARKWLALLARDIGAKELAR